MLKNNKLIKSEGGQETVIEFHSMPSANPLLKALLESVSDGVFLLDEAGKCIMVNNAATRIVNLGESSWIGQSALTVLPPLKRKEALEAFIKAKQGEETRIEFTFSRADRALKNLLMTLQPLPYDNKPCVLGIIKDVTALKNAVDTSRATMVSIDSLLRAAPTGICLLREGSFEWANIQFAELIGYNIGEIIGRPISLLYETSEESERVRQEVLEGINHWKVGEVDTRWRRKDGGSADVHLRATLLDPHTPEKGIILVALTTTETLRGREEIEGRRKYLEAVLRNAPDAMVTLDHEHRIVEWNPAARNMFGFSYEEAVGNNIDDFIAPNEVQAEATGITRQVMEGRVIGPLETVRYRKDGSPVNVSLTGSPVFIGGQLQGIVALYKDITEKKRTESALRQSEEKYRYLVENAPIGIVSVDLSGRILNHNAAFQSISRQSVQGGLRGLNLFDISPFDDPEISANFHRCMKESESGVYETRLEPGFPVLHLRYHITPTLDDTGSVAGAQGLVEDFSERKHLELQLQQAQKFEAIGTLAGGIAHDFNNLLMGIHGRLSLLLMESEANHPHREHLSSMEKLTKSATDLTDQLLGLARGQRIETRPTNINDTIQKCTSLFWRTRKDIKIHLELDEKLALVEADPGQIEQVLLNLLVNSSQAMPDGGDIFIATHNLKSDFPSARTPSEPPVNLIRISVQDTGMGMSDSVRERVFDPFFTTKKKERGTGLGLASAYSIIKNHKGNIQVRSRLGEGAEFIIFLPASVAEDTPLLEPITSSVSYGTETILLVDDEELILDVGTQLLEGTGYKPLCARNGLEAVDIYKEKGPEIELVILDMVMPDMDGSATYGELKRLDPKARILLSSGYSEFGKARALLRRGCDGFLQKPYGVQELTTKIREILDKG